MSMIEDQLSRTVALFQTDFGISDPRTVLRALTSPRIAIVASDAVAHSLAGQTAITTAAMLMARSGHQVFVGVPDAIMVGHQPPFAGAHLHEALQQVGGKLIDGVPINIGPPPGAVDIVFCLGSDLPWIASPAGRYISVGASDWEAAVSDIPLRQLWSSSDWPMGALAAAVLMAAEAIKITGRMLLPLSPAAGSLRALFEDRPSARMVLAPRYTPIVRDLGEFDIVSAGAVSNAIVYALYRIPGVTADARVFDRDISDGSNLNRNALLTTDTLEDPKVALFAASAPRGFALDPIADHYPLDGSIPLREYVMTGVDDVPTRWALGRAGARWMGVGATTHFHCMPSVHYAHSACAGCLHPRDEAIEGPTPTVSFVSFAAGLFVAAEFLREIAGDSRLASHHRYMTPLLPGDDSDWSHPVPVNANCPAGCAASRVVFP
jgi:hypothetical protein